MGLRSGCVATRANGFARSPLKTLREGGRWEVANDSATVALSRANSILVHDVELAFGWRNALRSGWCLGSCVRPRLMALRRLCYLL